MDSKTQQSTGSVATRLRQARQEAQISQERAAELLQIGRMSWIRYESGSYDPPLDVLKRASELFHRPIAWFLEVILPETDDSSAVRLFRTLPGEQQDWLVFEVLPTVERLSRTYARLSLSRLDEAALAPEDPI